MRYLDIHRASGFAEAYMNDIGHFEFGRLHRPILFDGMKEVIASHDPATLDYWLAYWIVAYGHISRQSDIEILDMGHSPRAVTLPLRSMFSICDTTRRRLTPHATWCGRSGTMTRAMLFRPRSSPRLPHSTRSSAIVARSELRLGAHSR